MAKTTSRNHAMERESERVRIWDSSWESQTLLHVLENSTLVIKWLSGRCKINEQKKKRNVQSSRLAGQLRHQPMSDHLDLFQHIYREWNKEAVELPHKARKCGPHMEKTIVEVARAHDIGG